jgi:sugar lactone lactonase YvrE
MTSRPLLVVALALGPWACYSPDYPETHRCSADKPRCPEGQRCVGTTCVPEGQNPDGGKPDGGKPDSGTDAALDAAPDTGVDTTAPDAPASGTVTTLTGSSAGHKDGPLASALFNWPTGVAIDGNGNLYVADSLNHCIRKIDLKGGTVSTIAGDGKGVTGTKDGPAASATFKEPYGIAVNAAGTKVYVADRHNHRIRLVSGGMVSTLAGGAQGYKAGQGSVAEFNEPCGVSVDSTGVVYVADKSNHAIRKISTSGMVTNFAGTGTSGYVNGAVASARFFEPYGLVVNAAGTVIYVGDKFNNRIRKIEKGQVTSFAGDGSPSFKDGPAATSQFHEPIGAAIAPGGGVIVVDRANERVRMIKGGQVTTVAGNGSAGMLDGPALSAKFSTPNGVAVAKDGTIYVADRFNHRIRVITP